MAKFIKLTYADGEQAYFNTDQIWAIERPNDWDIKHGLHAEVVPTHAFNVYLDDECGCCNPDAWVHVKETPEEIIRLIEEANK